MAWRFTQFLTMGARKKLKRQTPQSMYILNANRNCRVHKLSIGEPGTLLDGGPIQNAFKFYIIVPLVNYPRPLFISNDFRF